MGEHLLLDSQKQQVIKSLCNVDMAASDFSWETRRSGDNNASTGNFSVIIHRSTGFEISFYRRRYGEGWGADFTPGSEANNESIKTDTRLEAIAVADRWAEYLAREVQAKDYLAVAMQVQPLLPSFELSEENQKPFDEKEKARILDCLDRIESRFFSQDDIQPQHYGFVEQQLEAVRNDIKNISKFGFRNLLLGFLLNVGMTALGTDGTREIVLYAASQLGEILNVGRQLLID